MNSDCAFRIGRTHAVCQDYALARGGERPLALVADGCSSSPDTDCGARLLARAAERARERYSRREREAEGRRCWQERAIRSAGACADRLGLPPPSLDATLIALMVERGRWLAEFCGDGVLAWKDREGVIRVTSVSYNAHYPFYLNYLRDEARLTAFLAQPGNAREVAQFRLLLDGRVEEAETRSEPQKAECLTFAGEIAECEWVAAMSDGVQSFAAAPAGETDGASVPVPLPEVLRELLAFKNTRGVFVQRRMAKFLQACERRGWQHHDDIALGVIAFAE